jgi:hypothetical protein
MKKELTIEERQPHIDSVLNAFNAAMSTLPLDASKGDSYEYREAQAGRAPIIVFYLYDYSIHIVVKFTPTFIVYELECDESSIISSEHPYTDNHYQRTNFIFRLAREYISFINLSNHFKDEKLPIIERINEILR